MDILGLLCWGVLWGALGYAIGAPKGRAGAGLVWSVLLGPIGVVVTLVLSDATRYDCPACAEKVKFAATVCAHCGSPLAPRQAPSVDAMSPAGWMALVSIVLVSIWCCTMSGSS